MPIRRPRTFVKSSLIAAFLVVSCSGAAPEVVESRPEVPSCAPNGEVYIPILQGPAESESHSADAIECLLTSAENGDPAELEFTLVGTEGEEYRSILQTLEDGTVNYFRESDWGWELYLGCPEFSMPDPGIPQVSGCESTDIDGPG